MLRVDNDSSVFANGKKDDDWDDVVHQWLMRGFMLLSAIGSNSNSMGMQR